MNRSAEDGEWPSPHSGAEGTGVPPPRTKVCAGDTVGKSVSDPGRPGIVHREGMAGIVRHSQTKGRETGNAKPGLKMVGLQRASGFAPFVSMQNYINLIYREEEREMLPLCRTEGLAVTPWSPLARGFLAGSRPKQGEKTGRGQIGTAS